jgi:hypothetical protein
MVAPGSYRWLLVNQLENMESTRAGTALARLAVFDPNETIRLAAVDALASRPQDALATLLRTLRYPWSAAAGRAARALVALKYKEAVPKLIEMLDEPEPTAPFLAPDGRTLMRRELVRIRHHHNCLLCHAPSQSDKDPVREDIPMFEGGYLKGTGTFVRADVTYLRQDFSILLSPGTTNGEEESLRRFDFLVRVRELNDKEIAQIRALRSSKTGVLAISDQKKAIVYALKGLSGKNAGSDSAAWRSVLAGARTRKK